jgi:sugar (pentulose or hexulose) kinase
LGPLIVVLDVGKTVSKLTLWSESGTLVARETRVNERANAGTYPALDIFGIELWLMRTLMRFAKLGRVRAIFPVAHGAAAVIVRDGRVACPPIDYEHDVGVRDRLAYDVQRDQFEATGSPALPGCLNLGRQLHFLEGAVPGILRSGATILLWPQYWAWLLSGIAASEVSLGCHSDLWQPAIDGPSELATARGWAKRLPRRARAYDVLGTLKPQWAKRTGLPLDVEVFCGIHDSNAALLAARGFPEIKDSEVTVISTGTWFIAMRSLEGGATVDIPPLSEERDCLLNVDAFGRVVPSARFMGGREIETLMSENGRRIDSKLDQAAFLEAVPAVLRSGTRVLPTFAPGVGPFPHHRGRWINPPATTALKGAAVSLYAALVADSLLELIGGKKRIIVEGRFARAEVFVRALAALRPDDAIYTSHAHNDVAFGALWLVKQEVRSTSHLEQVRPLQPLDDYRNLWRRDTAQVDNP